jgi:CarD family transcriptional regulator
MYGIGDKVVYGAFGVMEIVDVTEQDIGDVKKQYYVLKEFSSLSSSLTYVPVDNEMLTSQMKPLLTKDEILEVVRESKVAPPLEWIEDNRARSEFYKKLLGTSDRLKLLLMIDAVRRTGIRRESEGKKNYIADENSMHRAEKLIATEFSFVLGIPENEVKAFMESVV